jgi:hypothetical protein
MKIEEDADGNVTRVPIRSVHKQNLPILVAVQLADVPKFKDVKKIIKNMVVTTVNTTTRSSAYDNMRYMF